MNLNKISLLTAALVMYTICCQGQEIRISATKFFGSGGVTYISDVVYDDHDKSFIFCGSADSLGSGDFVAKPTYLTSARNNLHLFVGKMDSNRNVAWVKMYGGLSPGGEGGGKILLTATGKIVIGGSTSSSESDATGNHSDYWGSDYWLLMLDGSGNKMWHRCYGGRYQEDFNDIKQTSDGGFVMIGTTNSPTSGDVPFTYVNSQFTTDLFIVKTDSSGNKQWTKTIGGTADELGGQIYQIGSSYYVVANAASVDHECSESSWSAGKHTRRDNFLIKLDSTGNFMWNKSYGSPDDDNFVHSVWDYRDSTLVLASSPTGSFGDFVPSPAKPIWGRTWILKVRLDGSVVWSKIMGDTAHVSNDNQYIQLSPLHGGYIVATEITPDNQKLFPGYFGGHDFHLYLLDSGGELLADKRVGSAKDDSYPRVYSYQNGYVLTGVTEGTKLNEGAHLNAPKGVANSFFAFLDFLPLSISSQVSQDNGDILAYPNPADEELSVSLSKPTDGELNLLTMDGKLVSHLFTSKAQNRYRIITAGLVPGNYLLRWNGKNNNVLSKTVSVQ